MADSRIHLVATGSIERDDAVRALKAVQWLTEHDHLELEGHALSTRDADADGDVRVEESKDADPWPLRGGRGGVTHHVGWQSGQTCVTRISDRNRWTNIHVGDIRPTERPEALDLGPGRRVAEQPATS